MELNFSLLYVFSYFILLIFLFTPSIIQTVFKPEKLAELAAAPVRKSGEKIRVCVLGDAAELYRGIFEKNGLEVLSEEFSAVRAENIGRLAEALPPEADAFKLAPIYLRKSAAEEKYSKKPI